MTNCKASLIKVQNQMCVYINSMRQAAIMHNLNGIIQRLDMFLNSGVTTESNFVTILTQRGLRGLRGSNGEFSTVRDLVQHVNTVANSDWGGCLLSCDETSEFLGTWRDMEKPGKQTVVNKLVSDLVSSQMNLRQSIFDSCPDEEYDKADVFYFRSENSRMGVTIRFVWNFDSCIRIFMDIVKETADRHILSIYDFCMARIHPYMACKEILRGTRKIVDVCNAGEGRFSIMEGTIGTIFRVLRLLFREVIIFDLGTTSKGERQMHVDSESKVGQETYDDMIHFMAHTQQWQHQHDSRLIRIERAAILEHDVITNPFYPSDRLLEIEGNGGHLHYEIHGTEIHTKYWPVYLNATNHQKKTISIRIWCYEADFFGGQEGHTCFQVSLKQKASGGPIPSNPAETAQGPVVLDISSADSDGPRP
jgi:hypothetical protein